LPGGYSIAGRIDVGFDGGNHPLRADYLRCRSCGSLLLATDQGIHERMHEAIDVTALAFIAKGSDPGPIETGR
jgi:hypothetical protein